MQKKTRKSFEIRTFSSFFHQKPRIFVENAHAYTYKHKKITHSQSYLQVGDRLLSLFGCRFQVFGVMRFEEAKNQLQHHLKNGHCFLLLFRYHNVFGTIVNHRAASGF